MSTESQRLFELVEPVTLDANLPLESWTDAALMWRRSSPDGSEAAML